jgi:hypothetical protein
MPLVDVVRSAVLRLAARGWHKTFLHHGLDLRAHDLHAELLRPLSGISRNVPGFEDFAPAGRCGIAPGSTALSLLYHGLASPDAYPDTVGPHTDLDFPTLEELDCIENYIYSCAKRKLSSFANPEIAVFAYQYRTAPRSPHQAHADMAFSRAGIARVGTAPMHYDPVRRSFWAEPSGNIAGIAVMPARYAVFIAERRPPSTTDSIMHEHAKDKGRTFLFPVHKLFAGSECVDGLTIGPISFHEFHRCEKLRRAHTFGKLPLVPGFDINQSPFVRGSSELVKLMPAGASTLLVPIHRSSLTRTATQHNSASGKDELVRFPVPAATSSNRFDVSSYDIPPVRLPSGSDGRAAPEYVHIRQQVLPHGAVRDLNELPDKQFFAILDAGGYEAAHHLDDSADGVITARVEGLAPDIPRVAAFSMVSAPDFLPLVDQLTVQRWAERNHLTTNYFTQGAPNPLCDGRDRVPNPTLSDPTNHDAPAFDRKDAINRTVMAVVGSAPHPPGPPFVLRPSLSTTWLSDAAADVFEPGWDVSHYGDQGGDFYATFGLGSPFPEDAKLCAALNSFWPAAAPDAGRTFGGVTALPLMDDELGFHPRHPKVLAGQASSRPGWDGEFGPFFESGGSKVNVARIERSDYTINALHGMLGLGLLGRIDAVEQLERMDAYRECVAHLMGPGHAVAKTHLRLVTAERIVDWSQQAGRLDPGLTDSGFLYVLAIFNASSESVDLHDHRRQTFDVTSHHTCQVSKAFLCIKTNGKPPALIARK